MPTRRTLHSPGILSYTLICLIIFFISSGTTLAVLDKDLLATTFDASGCPSALQFGDTVLCSLTVASEVDQFTFTATAGDHVFVRMASRTSGLEPQIRVLNPAATTICQTQSYGPAIDIDTCAIPTSGTYTILINDYVGNNTGNYGLSLQRINSPSNASTLIFGQTSAAALIAPGELDTYTITTESNDVLFLRMGSSTSGLRPSIRLYSSDGTKRCETYSYGSVADLSNCPPLAIGTYTLIVAAFSDGATGNYSLSLQRTNNPSNAAALPFGIPRTTTLAAAAEVDTYTFAGSAQDTIVLRMGSGTSGLRPQLRLYDPSGVKVCEAYSYGSEGELGPCLLPTTGQYVALINAFDNVATGIYGISLQRVNQPGAAMTLMPGVPITSVLTTTGQLATYTFPATTTDVVYLRLGTTSSPFDPHIRIFADDGAKICETYNYSFVADLGPCLLPRAGMYTVLADALNSPAVGEYGMTLQRINNPEQAHMLYFNHTQTSILDSPGDFDTYSFIAAGSSDVLLRMSMTTTSANSYVQIFSRDGTRLCSAYSYSSTAEISHCLLPSDGAYTVIAASLNGGNSNYNLTLVCLTGTCGAVQPPEEPTYMPLLIR